MGIKMIGKHNIVGKNYAAVYADKKSCLSFTCWPRNKRIYAESKRAIEEQTVGNI
jgi:hypothetical protein